MIIWTRSREILSVGPAVFHLRYSRDTETSASRAQDPGPPICTMGNRRYMAHAGAIFGPPGPQKLPMKSRRRGSPTSPAISGIAPFITIPPDLPEFGENGPTCGGCVKYGNLRILGQSHRIFRKSRRLPCESRKLHRRPVVVSLRCLREFPRSPNIIRKPPPPLLGPGVWNMGLRIWSSGNPATPHANRRICPIAPTRRVCAVHFDFPDTPEFAENGPYLVGNVRNMKLPGSAGNRV